MSELRTSLVIAGRLDPSLGKATAAAGTSLAQVGKDGSKAVGMTTQALGQQVAVSQRAAQASAGVGRALSQQATATGGATVAFSSLGTAMRQGVSIGGHAAQASAGVGRALSHQATATAGATVAFSSLGTAMRQGSSTGGYAARVAGSLGHALDGQSGAAIEAAGAVGSLGAALRLETAAGYGAAESSSTLGASLRRLEAEGRRGERVSRSLAQVGRQVDTSMGGAARATRQAGNALHQFAEQRTQALRGAGGLGAGDLISTAAVGSALRGGWRQSLAFDEAVVNLRTVINDEDPEAALQRAREHAVSFARDNMASEVEMIDIQYALNSAGLKAEEARVGSAVVSRVATVTKGMKADVGSVLATVYTNLGKSLEGSEEERLARVGDILAKTQAKFKFDNFSQLGAGFATSSAAVARFKIPLEQAAVALGVLNNAGIESSSAGTAYTAVLRQLSKAQEELGAEIVRGSDGQMDFIATMSSVNDALSMYDDIDERNTVIQDIFGDEGAAALSPFLAALGEMRDMEADVRDGSRSFTTSHYDRIKASTSGQWQQLGENIGSVGSAIMRTLHPAVDAILPGLNATLATVGRLIDAFPALGAAIGVAGAAFVAIKTYAVFKGVGAMLGGLRRAGRAGGAVGPQGGGMAGIGGSLMGGIVSVQVVNWPVGGFGGGANGAGAAGRGRPGAAGTRVGALARAGGVVRAGGALLARAAVPLAVGLGAVQAVSAASEGDREGAGGAVGGVGGMIAGAALGAAIGSVVPVIGTAIGGAVGGIIGSFGGEALGRVVGRAATAEPEPSESAHPDAIYAAEQQARIESGGQAAALPSPAIRTGEAERLAVSQVFTFNIEAPPGVDARDIAEEVKRLFRNCRGVIVSGHGLLDGDPQKPKGFRENRPLAFWTENEPD